MFDDNDNDNNNDNDNDKKNIENLIKKETSEKETPMMKQYREIKETQRDAFLFFRCGDFYEMFSTDAVEASSILDITLTKKGDIPMCGVPYHAVDLYIGKMIKAGKKIAICDQVEDPKLAKGIVKREITQIITPGTLVEEKLLQNKSNNFLLAIDRKGLYLELSYLDLSTGDFEINEIEFDSDLSLLKGEMIRINPNEVIIPEDIWSNDKKIRDLFEEREHILVNTFPRWYFESKDNLKALFSHFNIKSWNDLNINEIKTNLNTPAAVLKYVSDNAKSLLNHIRNISFYNSSATMILDETTIKNLELLENLRDGTSVNTLLEILDSTVTSMGGRLLKKWLIEPLLDIDAIILRQNAVDFFYRNQDILYKIQKELKKVMDLERLSSRIVMNKANPKDFVSIKYSLISCNNIYEIIKDIKNLKFLSDDFVKLNDVIEIIDKIIKDEPSAEITDGNIVKDGYNEELDELKALSLKSKEYIAGIENRAREKFLASTLRIKYNRILGYFFEISKIQSKNLDSSFILRQSLVNTCRYTSEELSEYESKILTAREKINKIEEEIFFLVRDKIFKVIDKLQQNAKLIARLDVIQSFALISLNNLYVKPEINNGNVISIKEGRHPVVELKLDFNEFIPNDLNIDLDKEYILIITGPNMSGKSTYLRQNALIVLMAQIGCFVPAEQAIIGLTDRIFTRIGTSDNLARGQSTFLVEMLETANILKKATKRSLIIMDEIGRGTSTYDGLAIAWSVIEYIHNKKKLGAKTLFATHYHELTHLDKNQGIKNLSIAISEEDEVITFLHKIVESPSIKSYGIHVAELANLPSEVILYAEAILKKLEEKKDNSDTQEKVFKNKESFLFDVEEIKKESKKEKIINDLLFLDVDRITPLESINILNDIIKKLKKI
jgi:DNA mismatch repair protein MutS